MEPHSVAFISCVNDEKTYRRCIQYLNELIIPPGYMIEIIPIYQAKSMTSGYNQGMRKSSSKYKVYLHQDTYIVNPFFIHNFIELFEQSEHIGMIGVAGTAVLPSNGTWWEGQPQYGKVDAYFTSAITLDLGEVPVPYIAVESIDGVLMVTQYDVEWNERVEGFHFYDAAQSIRFRKCGYQIIIPSQQSAWVFHYCLDDVDWAKYDLLRNDFVRLYENGLV